MIKERLLALPSEIEELKLKILNTQEGHLIARQKLKFWELSELARISNEVDDKGKPIYSNETKRQAELQYRKDTSEEFGIMEEEAQKLEKEVALFNIQLEKLINEQSNLRAICRLGDE